MPKQAALAACMSLIGVSASVADNRSECTDPIRVAGINMRQMVPCGLVGKGIDVITAYQIIQGAFTPHFIPLMLATSPRIVGEFVRALGIGGRNTQKITDALTAIHAAAGKPAVLLFLDQRLKHGQKDRRA
jgi:hypothetical protein